AAHAHGAIDAADEILAKAEVEQKEIVEQREDEEREVEKGGGGQKNPKLPAQAVHLPPEPQTGEAGLGQGNRVVAKPARGVPAIALPEAPALRSAAGRQVARQEAPARHPPGVHVRLDQAEVQPEMVLVGVELLGGG